MIKQLITAVFVSFLLVSGCAGGHYSTKESHTQENMSLEQWVKNRAVPYLTRELGENPRFKGMPFLLVSMDKENIKTKIDDLTMQLREEIKDGLIAKPGIDLVWRPSVKPWERRITPSHVQCTEFMKEKYYVGIDTSISGVSGKLRVRIRALDIAEKKWVTGFGISWQGQPSSMQKKALLKKTPDNCLLGLRPLPFNGRQADLLAASISGNLSCLFTTMELDEAIVYVKKENPDNIKYFDNAFNLVGNYLAMYRKVTVTEDLSGANIIVLAKVQLIHNGLYQVWVNAMYKKNKQYIPGRETEAYVSLAGADAAHPDNSEIRKTDSAGTSGTSGTSAGCLSCQKEFHLNFYGCKDMSGNRIFPMLRKYPGVTVLRRIYSGCGSTSACMCYQLTVDSDRYGKMENLTRWLKKNLKGACGYNCRIEPRSPGNVRIFFTSGFE